MTGKCGGLHCPGCGDGGGLAALAVVIVLAVIGAVLHAIWHTLVEVAEIAAWTVAGFAVLAAAGGIGYRVTRARSDRPRTADRRAAGVPATPRHAAAIGGFLQPGHRACLQRAALALSWHEPG